MVIFGSGTGLPPDKRQAIIWANGVDQLGSK